MHMGLLINDKYSVKSLRYNLGNYEIPEEYLKGTAIDVGCNNGSFLHKYKNKFTCIHAYEPNKFLFDLLKNNYKQDGNITIFNEAVYSIPNNITRLIKHKYTDDNGSFTTSKDIKINEWDKNEIICEALTVDLKTILERVGNIINVLKIDCENSEYSFLMEKDLSNINLIAIEIHHQLGEDKFVELFNFISKTHHAQSKPYLSGVNQEFIFINKTNK